MEPGPAHAKGHGRGSLRIYLGAAPGVGKTYAMLGEGRRRAERGTDVVIGFLETHGRANTAAMAADLEVVPRRTTRHRGAEFTEMDTAAVIARKPKVALIDELAHTNVPGSPNEKRWQDIEQILDAGIDVISTVNIQHLESVNDVVEAITGIKQRETVPDPVVRVADQIELVDMSPEALRRRMAHGNIYAPDKVDAALGNYFRVGNLTALRELALLWVADRVEEGLDRYREAHGIQQTWASKQRIVVAVTGGSESGTLLRRAAVITGRSAGRELMAVHVIRGDGTTGAPPQALAEIRQLTNDLGGSFHTVVDDSIPAAVLAFARSVNATQIVVGASRRGRLRSGLLSNTVDLIVRDSGDIDVHVVTHERAGKGGVRPQRRLADTRRRWAWVAAALIPVGVTALLLPFGSGLSLSTVLLTYLLGVVASSLIGGVLPALLTALLAALAANYYFTPPVGRFIISEPENAFALVVLVTVGVVVAAIVDRSAARLAAANRSQAEAGVLAAMSTGMLVRQDGVRGLLEQACETFRMTGATLFENDPGGPRGQPRAIEVYGTDAPLRSSDADATVDAGPGLTLAFRGRPLPAADRRLLNAFAQQTAAVLERNRLAVKAMDAQRLRQVDATRTALLQTVSHDLRTPLAGIKASLETLADTRLPLPDEQREQLVADALANTDRLQSMVLNLLDLSRLQAGGLHPHLSVTSPAEVLTAARAGLPPAAIHDETPDVLPLLMTDAGLLERILANLLSNAVRHATPERPVRVSASAVPGGCVEIRVIDRGPGLADSAKARMFEPFQRLTDSGSGLGLGLAVARGLSDSIGVELDVEDTPGGGLTMAVRVPTADGTAHDPDPEPS